MFQRYSRIITGEGRYANARCALSIVSRDLAIIVRARESINQDPEMTRKSLGAAVYEPAVRTSVRCGFTNTRINSGFIVPTGGGDWSVVPAARRVCARDACVHACEWYTRAYDSHSLD